MVFNVHESAGRVDLHSANQRTAAAGRKQPSALQPFGCSKAQLLRLSTDSWLRVDNPDYERLVFSADAVAMFDGGSTGINAACRLSKLTRCGYSGQPTGDA